MMLKERYVAESGQKNTPIKPESPAEVNGDSRQRQDALKTWCLGMMSDSLFSATILCNFWNKESSEIQSPGLLHAQRLFHADNIMNM